MKKQLLSILVIIFTASVSFSQIKTTVQSKAKEIKGRELVVVLEPETYPEVKKMNQQLKQAVKDHWDFSDNYIFVNKENLSQLKDTEFSILTFTKFSVKELTLFGGVPINTEMTISVGLSESFNPKFPACSLNLVHTYVQGNSKDDFDLIVNEKDIIFGVQRLNKMLWNAYEDQGLFYNEVKDRTASLEDKTLLIDLELLSDKFGEEEIKEVYPYQFKVMPSDQIAEKIKEKASEYAYMGVVRTVYGNTGQSQAYLVGVLNCENGHYISNSRKLLKVKYELKKKHIKSILRYDNKFKN